MFESVSDTIFIQSISAFICLWLNRLEFYLGHTIIHQHPYLSMLDIFVIFFCILFIFISFHSFHHTIVPFVFVQYQALTIPPDKNTCTDTDTGTHTQTHQSLFMSVLYHFNLDCGFGIKFSFSGPIYNHRKNVLLLVFLFLTSQHQIKLSKFNTVAVPQRQNKESDKNKIQSGLFECHTTTEIIRFKFECSE